MAICPNCQQEMLTADTCPAGAEDRTYPYGREPDEENPGEDLTPHPRCPDCGVLAGWWHHPGCAVAVCDVCQLQALMCQCPDRIGTP